MVTVALDGLGAGLRPSTVIPRRVRHPRAPRRLGVLARQHPVAAAHQDDIDTERVVGAGELGTGHAGADHDQPVRELVERRRPAPRSGSAHRRAARVEHARVRTGGDEHDVRSQPLLSRPRWLRPRCRDRRAGRCRRRSATPSLRSRRAMSPDCDAARCLTRALTAARSTPDGGPCHRDVSASVRTPSSPTPAPTTSARRSRSASSRGRSR